MCVLEGMWRGERIEEGNGEEGGGRDGREGRVRRVKLLGQPAPPAAPCLNDWLSCRAQEGVACVGGVGGQVVGAWTRGRAGACKGGGIKCVVEDGGWGTHRL